MEYDLAVRTWGAKKLTEEKEARRQGGLLGYASTFTDPAHVEVTFDYDEGNPCCGGRDPDCYCSMATSPRAEVVIRDDAAMVQMTIPADEFDFVEVLREIVEAAGGVVTAPVEPQPVARPSSHARVSSDEEVW